MEKGQCTVKRGLCQFQNHVAVKGGCQMKRLTGEALKRARDSMQELWPGAIFSDAWVDGTVWGEFIEGLDREWVNVYLQGIREGKVLGSLNLERRSN